VWQGGGSDFGVNDRLRCESRRRRLPVPAVTKGVHPSQQLALRTHIVEVELIEQLSLVPVMPQCQSSAVSTASTQLGH
jgi:hypothetical protein